MDLTDSTFILRNIITSELDQKSINNRIWARKLVEVSAEDALFSLKLAKAITGVLSNRPLVLLIPRGSIALYTEAELQKMGFERLKVPGFNHYYATKAAPTRLLFRKKKGKKAEVSQNAAQIIDLRQQWLELLPYEARFLEGKFVLRGAAWLEHLRLATENDILKIGNPIEWKNASAKERAKLDYCSITSFDRILIIGLLRKNYMQLTPRAHYFFSTADAQVKAATPKYVWPFIFAVSEQNRRRYFPL